VRITLRWTWGQVLVSKNQVEEIDKAMLRSIVFRQPYSPAGPWSSEEGDAWVVT